MEFFLKYQTELKYTIVFKILFILTIYIGHKITIPYSKVLDVVNEKEENDFPNIPHAHLYVITEYYPGNMSNIT